MICACLSARVIFFVSVSTSPLCNGISTSLLTPYSLQAQTLINERFNSCASDGISKVISPFMFFTKLSGSREFCQYTKTLFTLFCVEIMIFEVVNSFVDKTGNESVFP